MSGRQNKNLVIRLIKKTTHHEIVVARKRSAATARYDRIGTIGTRNAYNIVLVDFNKLSRYVRDKHILITLPVMKILRIHFFRILEHSKEHPKKKKNKNIKSKKSI